MSIRITCWTMVLLFSLLGCASSPPRSDLKSTPSPSNLKSEAEKHEFELKEAELLYLGAEWDIQNKGFVDAIAKLKNAYSKGYVKAAHLLGFIYRDMLPEKDVTSSRAWFLRSADNSYTPSYLELVKSHYLDDLSNQNYKEAYRWATKASVAGYDLGTFVLADLYYYGYNITQDRARARDLYESSLDGSLDSRYGDRCRR